MAKFIRLKNVKTCQGFQEPKFDLEEIIVNTDTIESICFCREEDCYIMSCLLSFLLKVDQNPTKTLKQRVDIYFSKEQYEFVKLLLDDYAYLDSNLDPKTVESILRH